MNQAADVVDGEAEPAVDPLLDVEDISDEGMRDKIKELLTERARGKALEDEAKEIKDRVKPELEVLMLVFGHPGVEMVDVGNVTWRNNGSKTTFKAKDILDYLVFKLEMSAVDAKKALSTMATVTKPKVEESVVFNVWKNGRGE